MTRRTPTPVVDERAAAESVRPDGSQSLTLGRWPPRDEPKAAAVLAAAIVSLAVIVGVETASVALASLVALALVLAAWRTFLPVTFVLDATGIEQRVLFLRRQIHWAAIARCEFWPSGVRLLRASAPHPLDALRSLFIPWQGDREAIAALLTRRALRARLVDNSGQALIPSTISQPPNEAAIERPADNRDT